ncbi:MAG: tetratricopeptide repeat protein [Chloroflexota bacterium]|nr:tetratricopeptide repeat protein [Chloroflexota bacterium]
MRQLPTGTVTLLFTDIEGSTQLLQRLGERYVSVLAECRHLLRAAFQRWNGHEIDTQGDAFFVAFARATDAVSAAVNAQRALTAYSWPEGGAVRVRMGLHTGEPVLAAEGYVGMDVHRAARIMSAGHGGQVLVSETTRNLVEQHLPDGVSLRDMGEQRLKDVPRPDHLFQLVIADLPADFPALKSLAARPGNLPMQSTPFIGRQREIATIEQLVRREDVRLLTLTGPGGMGKTRLALQVAASLSDLFADGIYFVDLAPVSDPAVILTAIAQTLGLREEGGQPLLEHFTEDLRHKHMLLLLDNFEQVIGAALQVAELLASCPCLKMIVTSRIVLRVQAEREYIVPPLSLPDPISAPDLTVFTQYETVALFTQRAQAVNPNFQLTVSNASAIAEILARLDGLPLAIELAAARMKLLSPDALLARLSQRLQVLTSGIRDVAVRQQTLRNTIEWSYLLLDAQEQQLFERLSIFAGGCTLEAVEAVCAALDGEVGPALDTISSLLDKSLLRRETHNAGEEPRFIMLETIREYGLEALSASGEKEAVRKAHGAYFLAFAQRADEQLWGPEQALWLGRLEQEHDNMRAAMQWSLEQTGSEREIALRLGAALRSFWYTRGYFSEGLDFLERALVQSGEVAAPVRAVALYSAARLNEVRGNHDRAETLITGCLVLYRTIGDRAGIAYALHLQADIAWGRGDLALARAQAEESLVLFRQLDNRGAIAGILLHLGGVDADQGEYVRALDLLEESLAMNRELGEKDSIAESLLSLARVEYLSQGDRTRARMFLEESFATVRKLGDKETMAYCLCLSGLLALDRGDASSARALIEQSMTLFKEMRQRHGTALALSSLAKVSAAQGDNATARTLYEEGIVLAREADNKMNLASDLEGLAGAVAAQGAYAWAARLWSAAEALRLAIHIPLPAIERPGYEQAVMAARAQLGEQPFAAAWSEGRVLTLEAILQGKDMRQGQSIANS